MLELVKKILAHDIGEVLASPLSLDLLRAYSILYLNGKQPSLCPGCLRDYYLKLQNTGIMKAEEHEKVKNRTCSPAWKGLKYIPPMARHYNDELITDDQAIDLLRKGYLKENDFYTLPDKYKSKKVEEEVMPKAEEKVETVTEIEPEVKPEEKTDVEPEVKPEPKPKKKVKK